MTNKLPQKLLTKCCGKVKNTDYVTTHFIVKGYGDYKAHTLCAL